MCWRSPSARHNQLQAAMGNLELALTEQKVKTGQTMERLAEAQRELDARKDGFCTASCNLSSNSCAAVTLPNGFSCASSDDQRS